MFFRTTRVWRWIAVTLLITLSAPALISQPSTRTNKQSGVKFKTAFAHGADGKKKSLSREQLAREAELWHELNRRRLAETHPLGAEALTADFINQDVSDISVIQDDGRVVTPPNPFDLSGRAVQFTPSGSGYTIAAAAAAFDNNIGTKLDLTVAPAVNPKIAINPNVEPGDDAYILKDFGFNFNFFGASFSSVAISSNGNLTFRPASISQDAFDQGAVSSIASLGEFQRGLPRIAPYWHDLDARAAQTAGGAGVFLRQLPDRTMVTWNNIRDFPNDPSIDKGVHRFQVTLFSDGRILFTYDSAQLTSQALAGITPGLSSNAPTLVNLNSPPSSAFTSAVGEFFSTSVMVDTIGAAQAFYATHPGRDVYDFVYLVTDFNFNLGDAFAFYLALRNDARGIGQPVGMDPAALDINSQRIQGILNLSNLSMQYPDFPTTRFLGANHALSIMGQEQGHRWLAYISYPDADPTLLLGRDKAHWSFFYSIPSTMSNQAAARSSSAEGNVWRDNGNNTFTSINLIDGYSRLDQYLMGLRPSSDVPDTFIITNPSGTSARRDSNPFPNVTVNGVRQNVTINQILQANGARMPDSTTAPKSFRAAVVLLTRQGTQPTPATLDKVTRYRLAWESYFGQSTDFLGAISTGLADQTVPRTIAAVSAASYQPTLGAGEISALYGAGLTSGAVASATSQPLPTTLAGTQVRINGVPAPLFFASPLQVNFQVPLATVATTSQLSVQSSTALIEVFSDGQLIRAGAFQIAPAVPAIFTSDQTGTGAAAAVDAFTGAFGPFNAKQSNGQPNIISVFGTGLGADATDVDRNVNASVQATIDGASATVDYAGRAPGFTGLNQFNLIFPANITSGSHTLVFSRNGIPSNQVTFSVR
ncbi:MAG TPA: hypothetical protein VKE91_06255 [Blastocatellia bacterium]|nr:hypothetical protein [Blastocatellia bacterium]